MTVTSFSFFALLAIGALVYYIVPKKMQWIVLLVLSGVFYYFAATPYTIIFLVISTIIAYVSSLMMEKQKEGKTESKIAHIAVLAVLFNVCIWFVLKGSSFWTLGFEVAHKIWPKISVVKNAPFAAALGMGYYTAQVIGYILDVAWGNAKAQKNPLKLFLFVCFFPQLTVGPISRYNDLKHIYEGHKFSYKNICFGSQRILWGVFKKLVISDRTGLIVNGVWNNTDAFGGQWYWVAVLLYPLQIYTDFSGCMDIVLGAAELFDIRLAENFKNPFFSRNSQEFWQRWHITLGTWARDYVYYPVLKSNFLVKLGRKSKNKFGKRYGKFFPWAIGMGILWFVMGFWHGSVQHIFGVSLWFWGMLVLSELFAPLLKRLIQVLKINTESFGWHVFQSVRTYFVYAIGAVFFSATGLDGALEHFGLLLSAVKTTRRGADVSLLGVTFADVIIIIWGVLALFVVAGLRETKGYARTWVSQRFVVLRWLVWISLLVIVIVYGMYGIGYDASSFIYQGF